MTCPQIGARDGTAERDMRVRSEPPLRLDGGEVLHVGLAVRRREHAPGCPGRDLPARERRRVLPPPCGAHSASAVWRAAVVVVCAGSASQAAADAAGGQVGVEFGNDLVELDGVLAVDSGFVSQGLCSGAGSKPELLRLSGIAGTGSGSVSRCQPSRHCSARSDLARSAHGLHTESSVAPQGEEYSAPQRPAGQGLRSVAARPEPSM